MYIVADIGATKMRLASSRDGKSFGKPFVTATPRIYRQALIIFREWKKTLPQAGRIRAMACGVPGTLSTKRTMLAAISNLPDWSGRAFVDDLKRIFKAPVYLENDTALVGLGEARYGAGKGYEIVAYVTVSTGVNGARLLDGRIDRTAQGFEIGKQIVSGDAKRTLESYISGESLKRRYGKSILQMRGRNIWSEEERWLAAGLHNTILHWSPHVVVLGGGVVRHGRISVNRISQKLKETLTVFPKTPPLKKAKLGDFGGLYGALVYLEQKEI